MKLPSLALAVAFAACSGKGEPTLEIWQNGSYQPQALSAYEMTGKRDGSTTRAVAILTMESGDLLRLELDLNYDPTPSLGSGRWRLEGSEIAGGGVRAESVTFLGGQGEGPSLGGRFLLEENGRPRFRVELPLGPVEQPAWTAE